MSITEPADEKPKSYRGFAAMSMSKQREIARLGGQTAQRLGTAHRFSSEEAREAGRKGGAISRRRPRRKDPHP